MRRAKVWWAVVALMVARVAAARPILRRVRAVRLETAAAPRSYRPRIRPIRGGLWGKHADLEVRDIGLGEWAFVVEETLRPTVSSFPAFTVDEILDNSGFDRVDILKVDIEGAEKEVFEGDVERWLGRVGVLVLELHDRFKPGCEEAVSSGIAGYPHTSGLPM